MAQKPFHPEHTREGSDLSRISKTLDKAVHPDVASQLKIGRPGSYAALITLANNADTVVTPIKQVFIDRGVPATVMEDLQASIDALRRSAAVSAAAASASAAMSICSSRFAWLACMSPCSMAS